MISVDNLFQSVCEFNGIYLLPGKMKFKRPKWNMWIISSTNIVLARVNMALHYFKITSGIDNMYFYNIPLTAWTFLNSSGSKQYLLSPWICSYPNSNTTAFFTVIYSISSVGFFCFSHRKVINIIPTKKFLSPFVWLSFKIV